MQINFTAFFDHITKGADIFGHDCISRKTPDIAI